MLRRVLIANRGEIAVRIARACRELGVESVAVYSDADRAALHTQVTDQAVHIGAAAAAESYLRIDALLEAAAQTGCDSVHPGYGFLAENAAFARAVDQAGLVFIGPPAEAIEIMGDKLRARDVAASAGVPLSPSASIRGADEALAAAETIGTPLLVKAAAGGGGKGMRIVRDRDQLPSAIESAMSEARSAFGDDRVYLERYVEGARHIEVQVLADQHGNVIHLGERECSIQRRHQKIIEESPSSAIDDAQRRTLTDASIALAREVGYSNAGTVEFLLDGNGDVFFLEMNTRLQVEHPITEWVTGIDLVQAQLRIAAGEPLGLQQQDVARRGHAIECRIYAEDAANQFAPSPALIERLRVPQGPWVRFDSGIREGFTIPLDYDPMLAKLSVWGADREAARRRMVEALRQLVLLGPTSTVGFLIDALETKAFESGDTTTAFIDLHLSEWRGDDRELPLAAIAAAIFEATTRPTAAAPSTASAASTPWQALGSWRPLSASNGK